jgi:hypothetical protein
VEDVAEAVQRRSAAVRDGVEVAELAPAAYELTRDTRRTGRLGSGEAGVEVVHGPPPSQKTDLWNKSSKPQFGLRIN